MVEEPGEHRPAGATAGQRMRVVMLVLTVFGFPLVLMLVFLGTRRLAFQPPFGDQPGGTLAGLLYDADGAKLAGVDVAAFVYPRAGEPRLHGTTTSDNGGAYAFEVPAIDGCYVVRAGGGLVQELQREVSLVNTREPSVDFQLRPGSEMTCLLRRRDGRPIEGGDFTLLRTENGVLGLPLPSTPVRGSFRGERLTRGGLAPGRWKLTVELDGGDLAEFELQLELGRQELTLEPF